MLPAILYIPLLGASYFIFDLFNTEKAEITDKTLQTTEFLNPNIPDATIRHGDGIGSKYENKTLELPENGIENRNGEYICLDVQTYDTYGLTKWSVEDDSIVSIDASGRNVCYVYPKKAGSTTVTVTDVAHPENTASTTVTVQVLK